jgi:hypothetical protein
MTTRRKFYFLRFENRGAKFASQKIFWNGVARQVSGRNQATIFTPVSLPGPGRIW